MSLLSKSMASLGTLPQYRSLGKVERVRGLVIVARGPRAALGEVCTVNCGGRECLTEVVGFDGAMTLLMALDEITGLSPGDEVRAAGMPLSVGVSEDLMGRVVNGLGWPIDGGPAIVPHEMRSLYAGAPHPLQRARVTEPLPVGVRVIDGLLTLGQGQRVGIFSGSGIGKSILLGMMARYTAADVVVIGLIGERGREVREFIEKNLGPEGLRKSIVVNETSDRWPLLRIKGALTATTIAEYFRDRGLRVLLLMDSISRVCHAWREVGLSLGEPPTTRGYPPSVFAMLPRLLERAGNSRQGTITALYTVLVEADDMNEPVADAVRSVLDGHIVLSRRLADRQHFPAVDVLGSISRVMPDIVTDQQYQNARTLKEWVAAYNEAEDLISIGAYSKGSRPIVDTAVQKLPQMEAYMKQVISEGSSFEEAQELLEELVAPA